MGMQLVSRVIFFQQLYIFVYVSSLDISEEYGTLLTSSVDCTVRMWTLNGHFIGKKCKLIKLNWLLNSISMPGPQCWKINLKFVLQKVDTVRNRY